MDQLKILASGDNEGAKSHARGKLFEKVSAIVLRHCGYEIPEPKCSINYAGMEIDIEGKTQITEIPIYAECKCYSSNVDCEKLQAFYGKYMTRWRKNPKAIGLFLALPGINSHAMGFYNENCESDKLITLRLLQERDVLDIILNTDIVARPESFQHHITSGHGTLGDRVLIYTEKGFFWLQYVVPLGSGMPNSIMIFDSKNNIITDPTTIDYIIKLMPELQKVHVLQTVAEIERNIPSLFDTADDVVEVRGSSTCFEYQFPAAPKYFVGRAAFLDVAQQFIIKVMQHETSSRGILLAANSGWGKSSLVLAIVEILKQNGHYAVAFDSRLATSPHFILSAINHVLNKFGDFDGLIENRPVLGSLDGACDALIKIGDELKESGKMLVIFFDQFENVFNYQDVLSRIVNLYLKVTDGGTNVVLGFSWKTDLFGLMDDFPYKSRDAISEACLVIHLQPFLETEINALLDRLASEMHTKLRKELRSMLSESSHGYPWLLKKLCAHVKNQLQDGVKQSEIVRKILNATQLFREDLDGLTNKEEEALRRIASLAPVSVNEIGSEFDHEILQSLVNRRLVVQLGSKYDVYWDIFRDYLNTGSLPVEEVYLLRAEVGSIKKALSILSAHPNGINIDFFKFMAGFSKGTFLNVMKDLRLLQLAKINENVIILLLPRATSETTLMSYFRNHLIDRLPRTKYVHNVLKVLKEEGEIDLDRLSQILKQEFPYITAVKGTWETYARILATWLDISDLAIWDRSSSKILKSETGAQVREHSLTFSQRRSEFLFPIIQFSPVLQLAIRIVYYGKSDQLLHWSTGISKSTVQKALVVLEDLALISRESNSIYFSSEFYSFARDESYRKEIARVAINKWPVFSDFLDILNEHLSKRLSHKELAEQLLKRTGANWKTSTAETNVKIMLDWARHLDLAVGPYANSTRGHFKATPIQEDELPFTE